MRIKIVGGSEPANALRGYLSRSGIAVVDVRPDYTVMIEEKPSAEQIVFDSIDCELERKIFRHMRMLTETPVSVQTAGGVQSDTELKIILPDRDKDRYAVEVGVLRGLLEVLGVGTKRRPWWKRILPLALLMILLPVPGWGQFQIYGIMRPSGPKHLPGYVPDPGAIAGITKFLREDATWGVPPGLGTVTSVGLALPAPEFIVAGSPVVGAGVLTGSWNVQHANTIFAGPVAGPDAIPGFRLSVPADIPPLPYAPITHNLLSATHPDTTPASPPTRGDIITAQGVAPLWTALAKGAQYQVLISGATDPGWSASPTIGTSVTTPIIYGGTAAGSTLTLAGTSNGAPVNAYVLLNPLSEGNVGIGIVAPLAALHVAATGAGIFPVLRIWNKTAVAADVGTAWFFQGGAAGNGLGQIEAAFTGAATTDGAYMTFKTRQLTTGALTERMRLDNSGHVGIGLSPSGAYALEVSGALSASSFYVGAAAGVDKVCTAAPTAMTVNKGIITAITCI